MNETQVKIEAIRKNLENNVDQETMSLINELVELEILLEEECNK
jgi:hypothetical protein